jgi:hypothetical protein
MHLTGLLKVLLPVFPLGPCLSDLLIGFISARINVMLWGQTITGPSTSGGGRGAMSNLDWAGQRFRQQMSLLKSPGTVIGKGKYS